MKGLFITATDTNVGKTWVGKNLIESLVERGISVASRKPVESGWDIDVTKTDAWLLAKAASKCDELDSICPNRFNAAVSPERAAALEGVSLSVSQLHQQCLQNIDDKDFLLVEGAGGFYSPLCSDGLNADLAASLNLPVLLVVEDRLGCINQTLLSLEAIEKSGLDLLGIVLNKSSSNTENHQMDNLTDIQKHCDYPVFNLSGEKALSEIERLCAVVLS